MQKVSINSGISGTFRKLPLFCAIALLSVAPCAFSQTHSTASPQTGADVAIILDDFAGASHHSSVAALNFSADASQTLSGSIISHLINGIEKQGPLRNRAKLPEANSIFSWAIDLAGLAGMVFCFRRRPAPHSV